jgi:isopentenyl diphosphate isomerase/L-lactate dehydrogenase-like FMN-dependent dehydrogenase
VRRAVEILADDLVRTMKLLGADSLDALEPALVRLRP